MIRGVVGFVRWGFYRAATVEGYTVTSDPTTRATTLAARLVLVDKFKLAQRPLLFEAPYQGGSWTWPIVHCELKGDQLTASLGPEEGESQRAWLHALSGQTHAH